MSVESIEEKNIQNPISQSIKPSIPFFRISNYLHSSSLLLALIIPFCFFWSAHAQQSPVNDVFTDYERVLHIGGMMPAHSKTNQPYSIEYNLQTDAISVHPWDRLHSPSNIIWKEWNERNQHVMISIYDPEIRTYWRNLKPGGINNGAIREERGVTSAWSTGLFVRYRFLSTSIRPMIIYNQNRDFPLSRYPARGGRNELSSPFYNIDTPQRFGYDPYWTFDPGPSYIRADIMGIEAGLSNQNRWWGPALHYPILMSNNAPGFWHYFAGTRSPQNIFIGDLDATIIWGKLLESDYFDNRDFNDERYITGMTLSYNPRRVSDLTLGLSRVYSRTLPPEGIPPIELLKVFELFTKSKLVSEDRPSGGDQYNQLLSLFARWVFPDSGFEIYGEWARNDHAWNLRDALGEPDHHRAYMAGFQKSFILPGQNILAVNAEIVNVEVGRTAFIRGGFGGYYTHSRVHQGYTNLGQIMGVGYGPGSSSQLLNGKYYFGSGKLSGWVRRTMYGNDYFYSTNRMLNEPENSNVPKYWLHNFELGFGTSLVYFYQQLEGEIGFELVREFNEDYLYKNDKTILAMNFRIRYRMSSVR